MSSKGVNFNLKNINNKENAGDNDRDGGNSKVNNGQFLSPTRRYTLKRCDVHRKTHDIEFHFDNIKGQRANIDLILTISFVNQTI